ncbi:5-hydroxytryptamine receptor 2A-like isoform X1 [Pimephales promelas]|uniref:5-hydroxytryptamine receptor 2A-like isoform X1 n=1 Tax=Pimephales promelas TaxID=90988 RepID=UPI001955CA5A|nr:5-hydroxytryptamine receptor 2A-like isoform X1 [Pimephales promelas]XP_039519585.1 5-hydroxytryptamine receptor 2A-like isoform X1 [Pimephales promelas]KAG1930844.1 5-hydroxytryptamine receptor 2A [Pimephales promelas]
MASLNTWNISLDINNSYFKSNFSELEDTQPTGKNWVSLVILAIIFFTVAGNILVIMAVSIESKLHNATNYFLCSLAVADMLVGFLVMPASLITILYNHTWPLPDLLCPMWIFLDVLFSTASIMHLCAISLDRYIGIRDPLKYGRSNSLCKAMLKIISVWTISIVLSLPIPVIGFQDKEKVFVNGTCVLNEPLFVLVGSSVAFFVPLVIMVVCYYLTLRDLQKHSSSFPLESKTTDTSPLNRGSSSRKFKLVFRPPRGQDKKAMMQNIKNEQRASKVLGIVFFLFLVMWTPFFITNVLIALCRDDCGEVLYKLINFFVWVGYVSSGVNPLIYTLFNKTYRQAFARYLQCRYREEKKVQSNRTC